MNRSDLRSPAADARRAGRRDPELAAKIRRSAWLLAGVAAAFYVGYIVWNYLGGPL